MLGISLKTLQQAESFQEWGVGSGEWGDEAGRVAAPHPHSHSALTTWRYDSL
jgi:hypothetical protein